MKLTSSRVTSRAASEGWQAAQIISNVHPDGPAGGCPPVSGLLLLAGHI